MNKAAKSVASAIAVMVIPAWVSLPSWVETTVTDLDVAQAFDAPEYKQTCQEDNPCWDCHTMGNRQCSPGPLVRMVMPPPPPPVLPSLPTVVGALDNQRNDR